MNRVLIVDDEPLVRDALRQVLECDSSLRVEAAADASEALTMLRRQPFDVAIVDIIMPGMDGVKLIGDLRSEHPGVRILAMSGGGKFEAGGYRPQSVLARAYLAAAAAAGAHAVLAKPFDVAELDETIRPLLQAPRPRPFAN